MTSTRDSRAHFAQVVPAWRCELFKPAVLSLERRNVVFIMAGVVCCLRVVMANAGGFAVQVTVDRPDVQGRVRILKVHSRGKQIGKDVDFEKIARRTPGVNYPLSETCSMIVSDADNCCCAIFNGEQLSMTPHMFSVARRIPS